MKTLDGNINIYKFDELSERAQDKAKYDAFISYPAELMEEELTNLGDCLLRDTLPCATFEGVDYNLNWSSQDYGAVIKFKYTNLNDFLRDFSIVKDYLSKKMSIDDIDFDQIYFEFLCDCDDRFIRQKLDYDINGYDDKTDELASILDEYLYRECDYRIGEIGNYIKEFQSEFTDQVENTVDNLVNNEYQFEDDWYFADGKFAGLDEDF